MTAAATIARGVVWWCMVSCPCAGKGGDGRRRLVSGGVERVLLQEPAYPGWIEALLDADVHRFHDVRSRHSVLGALLPV